MTVVARAALAVALGGVLGCNEPLCREDSPLSQPDGGNYFCTRPEDCPRPSNVLVCATTGELIFLSEVFEIRENCYSLRRSVHEQSAELPIAGAFETVITNEETHLFRVTDKEHSDAVAGLLKSLRAADSRGV